MKGLTIRRKYRKRNKKSKRTLRSKRHLKQRGGGDIEESYPDAVVVKQRDDPNEIIDGLPVVKSAFSLSEEV
jgi:hypothetical protein